MIRAFEPGADLDWAQTLLDDALGGRMQARRGELVDVLESGTGLVAEMDGRTVGLITWTQAADAHANGGSAEIRAAAVAADVQGRGIGRALFEAAHASLASAGVGSVWLVTTNDNSPAIRLYESLGYRLVETRRGAIDDLRRTIKPSIPLIGHDGLEMHDELEYARRLG